MDPETVHCAFRLLRLLESHHQLSRSFDYLTRQLITLITQSTANPPPFEISSSIKPTKESVQADLKYLANAIYKQATQTPKLPTTTEIHQTVISAIDKCFASAPPPPPSKPAALPSARDIAAQLRPYILQDISDEVETRIRPIIESIVSTTTPERFTQQPGTGLGQQPGIGSGQSWW